MPREEAVSAAVGHSAPAVVAYAGRAMSASVPTTRVARVKLLLQAFNNIYQQRGWLIKSFNPTVFIYQQRGLCN